MAVIAHWAQLHVCPEHGIVIVGGTLEEPRCLTCGARAAGFAPVEQLRGAVEALHKYGRHTGTCARLGASGRRKCDCGWDEIRATHPLGGQYDAAPSAAPDDVAELDEGENYRRQRDQDRQGR